MSRLRLDPAYKLKDLAFTASDHVNVIRIRDTLSDLVEKMGAMSEDISDLKKNGGKSNDNISVSEIAAETGSPEAEPPEDRGVSRLTTAANLRPESPSRISFKEKVRRFSTLGDPQFTQTPNL